jgi:hypothetical protein
MPDRMVVFQERDISADAANRIGILLDSIDRILAKERDRIKAEATAKERDQHAFFAGLPEGLRWRIMVLGCSVEDMNFWVRRKDEDGGRWHLCTEIETGMTVGGVDAREAVDNYFKGDLCG